METISEYDIPRLHVLYICCSVHSRQKNSFVHSIHFDKNAKKKKIVNYVCRYSVSDILFDTSHNILTTRDILSSHIGNGKTLRGNFINAFFLFFTQVNANAVQVSILLFAERAPKRDHGQIQRRTRILAVLYTINRLVRVINFVGRLSLCACKTMCEYYTYSYCVICVTRIIHLRYRNLKLSTALNQLSKFDI